MDSQFPGLINSSHHYGITTSAGFYIAQLSQFSYEITILSVTKFTNKVKITYTINCTLPAGFCADVNLIYPACRFSSDGIRWFTMTPLYSDIEFENGPLVTTENNVHTFIWDSQTDVGDCVIDNYDLQLMCSDTSNVTSNIETGFGTTDDFIVVKYSYPANGKLYIGYEVNTFDTNFFCLSKVEWSKDGVEWHDATNDSSDILNSPLPRATHVTNVFVWDWSKDTESADDTCIRFTVYKIGATEPEIERVPQIILDHEYYNGVGIYYDGWFYNYGGTVWDVTGITQIYAIGQIVVTDIPSDFVPGFEVTIIGSTLGNNLIRIIQSVSGNTITFTSPLVADETIIGDTCVARGDSKFNVNGYKREAFFRFNLNTFEVQYKHIVASDNASFFPISLDINGNEICIDRNFSVSYTFIDEANKNIYFMKNEHIGGGEFVFTVKYYNPALDFWRVTARLKASYIGLNQGADWTHDGWWYLLGGYITDDNGIDGDRPSFFRISIDSLATGNLIVEDLLPGSDHPTGLIDQSLNPYAIGSITVTRNPVTTSPDIRTALLPVELNNFMRWNMRGIRIPNTNKFVVTSGTDGVTAVPWKDSLIFDADLFYVYRRELPNGHGFNNASLFSENGTVIIFGGNDEDGLSVSMTFDPCFDSWRENTYPDNVGLMQRTYSAYNGRWLIWGGQDLSGTTPNTEGRQIKYLSLQSPPTASSNTSCYIYANHSTTWYFGPGEEFPDFNTAYEKMIEFYHGQPLDGDVFILGSGSEPYRSTRPLNGHSFKLITNGHKVIIGAKEGRITFTGNEVIPNSTFIKYIEDQEPTVNVWKSDFFNCKLISNLMNTEVYEDGKNLIQKNSLIDVENTPGSYYIDDYLYIHSTDSSKARIDHHVYEATVSDHIFEWISINDTDKAQGITFIDLDIEHTRLDSIYLKKSGNDLDHFSNASIVNCRFKTNHGAINVDGAIDGITITKSSIIDDNLSYSDLETFIKLSSVRDNININKNYIKAYKDAMLINVSALSNSDTLINDNIFINGNNPIYIDSDTIQLNRNMFRIENLELVQVKTLNLFTYALEFIGNAVIGLCDNQTVIYLNHIQTQIDVKNNTVWSDRGINQTFVKNINSSTVFNFKLNLMSLRGLAYDNIALGNKEGNVYLVASGTAPTESKSRSSSYRNIFSRELSYGNIDALDIVPVDGISKRVLIKTDDIHNLDITGAIASRQLDAGCIQTNGSDNVKVESFRWLPLWTLECSLPETLKVENRYNYPNRYRSF